MRVVTSFCAALLTGGAIAAPITTSTELGPVVDGAIFDQNPFDGVGDPDGILDDGGVAVFLNSAIVDSRGAVEFDLTQLRRRPIKSAQLRLTPRALSFLPGTQAAPIQLFGYPGNGALDISDFNEGTFVTVYNALPLPLEQPFTIDVTRAVKLAHKLRLHYLGFSLRTNVDGFQHNYGSLDLGLPIQLVVQQ